MSSRYDREYERIYDEPERDYRNRQYRPNQYGGPPRPRIPQPEFPDRISAYRYAPDENYGDTYASDRYFGRGYGYGRDQYGTDYEHDYGYGRDGVLRSYSDRYQRTEGRPPHHKPEHHDRNWWDRTKDELASWFGDEEAERRRKLDELRAAPFRGRGPRGYRRSDDRIQEDVNDRLTDHPYLDAYEIVVSVAEGEVTLSGLVGTRYEKRLAEDLASTVSGVLNVQNNLRSKESQRATDHIAPQTNIPAARAAGGAK